MAVGTMASRPPTTSAWTLSSREKSTRMCDVWASFFRPPRRWWMAARQQLGRKLSLKANLASCGKFRLVFKASDSYAGPRARAVGSRSLSGKRSATYSYAPTPPSDPGSGLRHRRRLGHSHPSRHSRRVFCSCVHGRDLTPTHTTRRRRRTRTSQHKTLTPIRHDHRIPTDPDITPRSTEAETLSADASRLRSGVA